MRSRGERAPKASRDTRAPKASRDTRAPKASQRDRLREAALVLLVLGIYAAGLCRTVYVGDSGDLLTATAVLGIPHPSGYPLYVLLAKLWSLLFFFLPLPASVSLLSAVCAAAACGLVYRIGREEGVRPVGSAGSALLLAFSPSFWGEANVQRVYALNALFLALATLYAFRWARDGGFHDLAFAFLLCGLGACNHLYMAVFGGALAIFAFVRDPSLLRKPARIAALAGLAAAGLLPYLYLPLRARSHPLLQWGDPETAGSLVKVVLREDFWRRSWARGPADFTAVARDYGSSLVSELAWIGAPLALIGALSARRFRRPVLLPLLAIAGNVVSMALHGSRTDLFFWHRYYIPSYLMLAILAGWGFEAVAERLPRTAIARLAVFAAPAVLLVSGFRAADRSRYRIAEAYSDVILSTVPPGTHLIASDDNILFVLMYLNLGEKRRPDVDLVLEGVGGARLPPLAFNPDRAPVFLTHHANWGAAGLEMVPVGLLFRAWRAGRPWPDPLPVPDRLEGEDDPKVPKDYLTQNLIGEFHYMRGVTFERRDWLAARREFRLAEAAAPDNDVLFYNLGLIFAREGLYEDSLAAFRRSERINPREIPSLTKPRASDRAAEVEAALRRLDSIEESLAADPSLAALPRGSPAFERALADSLEARGEEVAARGHRLRALELE